MMRPKIWLILFSIACTAACSREGNENVAATVDGSQAGQTVELFSADIPFDQIVAKLSNPDERAVLDAVTQLAPLQQRREVLSLLLEIWHKDEETYPALNWAVLSHAQGRIAVAKVLGAWNPADPQYRAFILDAIKISEGVERLDALVALGSVATDADVALLDSLGRRDDELVAAGALAALQIANAKGAREALERIAADLSLSEERRRLATQLLGLPRDQSAPRPI